MDDVRELLHWLRLQKNQLLWLLAILVFVAQFSSVVHELSRYSTNQSILQAFDDDAAAAIEVAEKTRWYWDNHWSAYGPLYYRFAHTLDVLSPLTSSSETSHFHLLMISLLAAYAVCGLLSFAVKIRGPEWLLSTCILLVLFLSLDIWRVMLFRAHPDWLLSLTAAFTAIAVWQMDNSRRSQALAAMAIALGMLTKATFILCLPTLLLIVALRKNLRPYMLRVALWSLGFYFLIGFPQSLRLDRDIKFLIFQSAFNRPPDLTSALNWLQQSWNQLWLPMIGVVILWLIFSRATTESREARKSLLLRAGQVALFLLPILVLMTRKVIAPAEHYTMPFVTFFLAGLCMSLKGFSSEKVRTAAFLTALVAGSIFGLFTPRGLDAKLNEEAACRLEAAQVKDLIQTQFDKRESVFMDPYVPFPRERANKDLLKGGWRNSWRLLGESHSKWMVLNQKFFERYLGEISEYGAVSNANAAESKEFYHAFNKELAPEAGAIQVQSPDGKTWILERSFTCGWKIWRQE